MKKYVMVVLLLILIAPLRADEPFKIAAQAPPYVRPGDENVNISITVKVEDEKTYEDVEVEMMLPEVFSISEGKERKSELGDLSKVDEMRRPLGVAVFQIDVLEDAKYGEYKIGILVRHKKGIFEDSFKLKVIGDTLVGISKVSRDKENVESGEKFTLTLYVENMGSNSLDWLKIVLQPNPSIPQNLVSEFGKIPVIIPISEDLERIFQDLGAGREVRAVFELSVDKNSSTMNYPLNVLLIYQDETDTLFQEVKTIGISIKGRANLDLSKMSTNPQRVYEGDQFSLKLSVENTGTEDARGVRAELEIELFGDEIKYLGEVKKGSSENVTFNLDASKAGTYSGKLKLFWEDDYGENEVTEDVSITIYPLKVNGYFSQRNLLLGGVGVFFVVAVVVMILRRR
ncbi:MAG: COG1361 S-layer family protein [Candidatus Methanofastidiosia archaeon]